MAPAALHHGGRGAGAVAGEATDALTRGLDTASLRESAGASRREHEDRVLFMAAVQELGCDVPDGATAT